MGVKGKTVFIIFVVVGMVNILIWDYTINRIAPKEPTTVEEQRQPVILYQTLFVERHKACSSNTFKSWEDYRSITNQNSSQYAIQRVSSTDSVSGIRLYQGYYLVAVSSSYGVVGDLIEIHLENGTRFFAVIGDIKGSGHSNNCESDQDGSMLEFIVDSKVMPDDIRFHGDYNIIFKGSVKEIWNYGSQYMIQRKD